MSAHELEDRLRNRLAVLAEERTGTHPVAALAGDLGRGHRALRRRTALRSGLAAVAVAAVVGAVGVLGTGGGLPRTGAPPAAQDTASASPSASPSTSPTPSASSDPAVARAEQARREEAARKHARDRWITARLSDHRTLSNPFKAWRDGLFAISKDRLDPGGGHLDYATDSLQSGYGSAGISLGIKMGWHDPGAAGQGMVSVAVSDGDPTGEGDPCFSIGVSCPVESTFRGVPVRRSDDGTTVVAVRPDGLVVMVHVQDLFGNDAKVGVNRVPLTVTDLSALALDNRIALPEKP